MDNLHTITFHNELYTEYQITPPVMCQIEMKQYHSDSFNEVFPNSKALGFGNTFVIH